MKRNPHLAALSSNYLFPEINTRKQTFLAKHPQASLISLGIGDTTEPIPSSIVESLKQASQRLGTKEGYSGYGSEQGNQALREKIAAKIYHHRVCAEEVFISDGAKCDIGRLQVLFGSSIKIAVQDPAYPVYVDGSLLQGISTITPLPCLPENGFFPNLDLAASTDLIYFCSPNNPTGAVATHTQLKSLVDFAKTHRSILLFDAAYSTYIQDPSLPKSIYEIEGAHEVAIEIHSFSKLAGFTGIRLGWTVIPEALRYEEGHSIRSDWNRLTSTLFNGASNIAQAGGLAALEEQGLQEIAHQTQFYMENAALLKATLQSLDYTVYGGVNAPYLWLHFPGKKSWDMFQYFLERFHIITTPGSGFGPGGEGFLRLTAFGHRKDILEAIDRLKHR